MDHVPLVHAAAATVLVAAAVLSLWLMRFTRRLLAWRLFAVGFVLLAIYVALDFVYEHLVPWAFWGAASDTVLLAAALLLAAGVAQIRPIFLEYRREQEVLERAQREWQLAFDAVRDPVFLHDANFRIVRANRAYCARAGLPLEELLGKLYWKVFPKGKGPLPACRRAMEKAEEEAEEEEVRLETGEVLVSRSFAVRDASGAYLYSFHILMDITERKEAARREAREETRLRASLGLGKFAGKDDKAILDFVMEESIRITESRYSFIGWISEDEQVMTIHAWSKDVMKECAVERPPIEFPIAGAGVWAEPVRTHGPLVLNDYSQFHPAKHGAPPGHVEISRYLGVPVIESGRVVAIAAVANKARDYDEHDVSALSEFVADAWSLIQRRRAGDALRASEDQLRTISDTARDAIVMIDDAGRIVFWNPGAEATFGYARDEALGRDIGELIVPPRMREDHRRGMEQFRQSGTGPLIGKRVEVPALRKNGEEFWSEHHISAVRFEGRWHAIGIGRDLTERKAAESQRRNSDQRYRQILRTSMDGFWIADIEGRILEVNDAYCRMTGYSRDELMHMRVPDLEAQETPEETARHIQEIRRQGHARFETRHRCKDGQLLDFEVSVDYRPDAVSGPVFLRDITERKRAEKKLRDSEERLRGITERNVDGILVVDEEGRMRFSNPAAQAMFGRTAGELERQSFGLPLTAREAEEIELVRREGPLSVEMRVVPTDWEGAPARLVVLHDLAERKRAEAARAEAAVRLHRTLEDAVGAIAATVEMRDPYTAGHQRRVAALAVAIARELGLAKERIEGLHLAGTVHDLGKIHIPAEILAKPGRLSEIEFSLIKTHPQAGYEILKEVEFPWPIAQIVYQHHERLDGSGYPNGLKGEAILPEARIMMVADVVEAMSSHRPYRPALGTDLALAHVIEKRGAWYEPQAVDACVRLFREKGYTLGQ